MRCCYWNGHNLVQPGCWHRNHNGVQITATFVPPGLPSSHNLRAIFDDRTIAVLKSEGTLWLNGTVRGHHIAHAYFGVGSTQICCDTVDVHLNYRRKGLATAMYDFAEDLVARPAVQSEVFLSTDAPRFWDKRRSNWIRNKLRATRHCICRKLSMYSAQTRG